MKICRYEDKNMNMCMKMAQYKVRYEYGCERIK